MKNNGREPGPRYLRPTVIHTVARMAVRRVGKVMGLSRKEDYYHGTPKAPWPKP